MSGADGLRLRAASALLCCTIGAAASAGEAQENHLRRVTDIVVEAPAALLQPARDAVAVRRGETYQVEDLRRTMQNIYALGRVSDVRVATEDFNGGVRVVVEVLPAPHIAEIGFAGDSPMRRSALRDALTAAPGDRLSRGLIEEQAARLQSALSDRGYLAAVVEPELLLHDAIIDGTLLFHIDAGAPTRLDRLAFVGDLGIPESTVRTAFGMQEGGVFRYDTLATGIAALRRVLAENRFFHARVEIAEQASNQAANTADLVIGIDAGPQVELEFGGWNRSREELLDLLPFYESASIADWILLQARGDIIADLQQQGYWKPLVAFGRERDAQGRNVSVRFTVAPVRETHVRSVRIDGNVAFPERQLLGLLETSPRGLVRGSRFSSRAWMRDQRAVTSFYRRNGFLQARITDAAVSFDAEIGGLSATLAIDEGTRTDVDGMTLDVEGHLEDYGIDTSGWSAELTTGAGRGFDPEAVREDETKLLVLLSNQGFMRARVTSAIDETTDPFAVNVSFRLNPGRRSRVGQLLISGNELVREEVIRRELTLVPGSPLTQDSIIRSQSRLYQLGVFSRVEIDTARPDSIDTDPTVVIRVTEGSSERLSWGLGYSTEEQARGLFVVGHDNLWGRNHSATASVRASFAEQRVRFIYTNPYVSGRAVEGSLVGYFESIDLEGFKVQRIGTSLQLVKRHSDSLTSIGRYSFRDQRTFDVLIDENELEPEDTAAVIGSVVYSLLSDTRPNPIEPVGGIYTTLDAEWAARALAGESNYVRLFGRSYWYWQLPSNTVLVAAGRAGLAKPYGGSVVPLPERYFAGGSTTLRGLGRNLAGPRDENGNPLGGEVLLIGNVEYRFPITGALGAVIFADVGNVFADIDGISLAAFRQTLGFGVRFSTPIGPLRLDWGRLLDARDKEDKSRLHFAIGHAF